MIFTLIAQIHVQSMYITNNTLNIENKIKNVSRQYCNDYLYFGFVYIDEYDGQISYCVVCG